MSGSPAAHSSSSKAPNQFKHSEEIVVRAIRSSDAAHPVQRSFNDPKKGREAVSSSCSDRRRYIKSNVSENCDSSCEAPEKGGLPHGVMLVSQSLEEKDGDGDEEEGFDMDLPSDMPSGLLDIEGNIIGTIRLGQEEDGEEEDEFGGEDLENFDEARRLGGMRKLSTISNGRVFTHGRGYHLHNHCHRHDGVNRDNSTSAQSNTSTSTITQHYYPEGGWGWVVLITASMSHILLCGINFCVGLIIWAIMSRFGTELRTEAGLLGACSVGISLLLSPVWVAICKRKSTRLTAVFGGLVASLGCLFTSFATQFHQVFFSYSVILGVGVGLSRDASSLMVGQYFKRKRDLVEIMLVAASGLGILLMSILINNAINSLGWRLGLQAITGTIFFCFFLGTCYRSASLYHPQRRAILHLKNQKRKVKEKERRDDRPPFIDCGCLRSKTVQILLISSACSALGIYTPLFYLAIDVDNSSEDSPSVSLMYIYVGVSWIIGCAICGAFVVQKSKDCRVSKQYLCQVSAIICGFSIVTFAIVKGQSGLIIFSCIYGFSLGGYSYALKIYTYEKVRARHFPRAWSFIQSSQAIPVFLGVPLTGYLNDSFPGLRCGYYLSAAGVFLGAICLFLTNVRKRRLSRRKSQNSSKISTKTCETTTTATTTTTTVSSQKTQSPKLRRLSFAFPVEQISPEPKHEPMICDTYGNEGAQGPADPTAVLGKELTCISEEAIAEMDFQDIYYEEWEDFLGGECITSCNRVEDCLVSEFQPAHPRAAALQMTRGRPAAVPTNNHIHFTSKFHNRRAAKGINVGPLVTAAAVARSVASLGTRLPPVQDEEAGPCSPEADLLLLSLPSASQAETEAEEANIRG